MVKKSELIQQPLNKDRWNVSQVNWDDITTRNLKKEVLNVNKEENIERSIFLIEHVGVCMDSASCEEGEGCRRCKSVMAHFWSCLMRDRRDCSVCRQVETLCKIHCLNCKSAKLSCVVPFCTNTKVRPPPSSTSTEYRLLVRRLTDILKMPQASASQYSERKEKMEQFFVIHPWTIELLRQLYNLKQPRRNQNVKQARGNTGINSIASDGRKLTDVILSQINPRLTYLSLSP